MSILKKVGRALGFSGEDDELESQPYTAENITNACVRDKGPQVETVEKATPAGAEQGAKLSQEEASEIQLPDTLLDVLVEMLNRSLPEYVLAALDKDTEKKYLFEQLDEPFKKFIADVNVRSREWVARKWETKHQALTREVEEARVKVKELEEQRNTMQSAQLSAERQKRAVTEKVHELEARIATLEAEKEQFELENKSLVNKLKVSNVHQEELDSAFAEITQLKSELKKQTENSAEVDQLRTELQQARADLSQAREAEQAAATQAETAQKELARQEEKVSQLSTQIQTLEAELAEAQSGLKVMDEVEAKLHQFEQVKASKDEKIAQLNKELQTLGEANSRLQTRLSEMAQRNERLESQTEESASHLEALNALKADLESANALVAALRSQRQELLSQIETLQAAKPVEVEKSDPVVAPSAPVEEKPEPAVISFDAESGGQPAAASELAVEVEPVAAPEKPEQPVEQSVETPKPEKKHRRKAKSPEKVEEVADDDFPGLDTFGDNWLIPTRPDTPEMIAKRKEDEKKKREAEEQAALEQKKAHQIDPSQMSLW